MRRRLKSLWSDDRGSAVALVAVSLAALVSLLALGIDVGMLFNARSEAQRAADSAALAGASAFLDFPAREAVKPARERAVAYAIQNRIRNEGITESEVSVVVNPDSATVTVGIRRAGVSTWFARLIGETEVPIGAQATAQASDAGTAQCLKPFAVPDMWDETNDDTNHNRIWDDGEIWHFDPGRDRYEGYSGDGAGAGAETGYGSEWRDFFPDASGASYHKDYGRRIMIKATDPHSAFVPSFFYPWVLPVDANQPDCGEDRAGNDVLGSGKGNGNGGNAGGNAGGNGGGNGGNGGTGGNAGGNGGGNGGTGGNAGMATVAETVEAMAAVTGGGNGGGNGGTGGNAGGRRWQRVATPEAMAVATPEAMAVETVARAATPAAMAVATRTVVAATAAEVPRAVAVPRTAGTSAAATPPRSIWTRITRSSPGTWWAPRRTGWPR